MPEKLKGSFTAVVRDNYPAGYKTTDNCRVIEESDRLKIKLSTTLDSFECQLLDLDQEVVSDLTTMIQKELLSSVEGELPIFPEGKQVNTCLVSRMYVLVPASTIVKELSHNKVASNVEIIYDDSHPDIIAAYGRPEARFGRADFFEKVLKVECKFSLEKKED